MILSHKLCINILLKPVKVDIKRTNTKTKLSEIIQMIQFISPFLFAIWPFGTWFLLHFPAIATTEGRF